MIQRSFVILLFLLAWALPAFAADEEEPMRLWEDRSGDSIRGRMIDYIGETVILLKEDGREVVLYRSELSVSDLKYVDSVLDADPNFGRTARSRQTPEKDGWFIRFLKSDGTRVGLFILFFLGCSIVFIGGLMFLYAAFDESLMWFIGALFLPIGIVFLYKYWDSAKRGFLWQLVGGFMVVLALLGFGEDWYDIITLKI